MASVIDYITNSTDYSQVCVYFLFLPLPLWIYLLTF